MVSTRDRIITLKDYLESEGVEVKLSKTSARGNKGIFLRKNGNLRIDISKKINDESTLSTLIHEFSHFLHFKYDSALKSLNFIFDDFNDDLKEELINVSADAIPKEFAQSLLSQKYEISKNIKNYSNVLKQKYTDFKLSKPYRKIESQIKRPLSYLLKYDNVKLGSIVYSIENINKHFPYISEEVLLYIKIKSNQRLLRKINSRINKLNRYYSEPSELFARFLECYFLNKKKAYNLAPFSCKIIDDKINANSFPMLNKVHEIIKSL